MFQGKEQKIKKMKEVDTMSNSNTPKKPTKREMFTALLNLPEVQNRSELVDFIQHEIDLLTAKNTKPTAKQTAKLDHDAVLRSAILAEMEKDHQYTADEMIKTLPTLAVEPDLTAPKVSYLMRDLLAEGKVTKSVIKRKTYWQIKE